MPDEAPPEPRPPEQFAQTPPKGVLRSYDEMNTGQMVFELQGTVGELKSTVSQLAELMKANSLRLEAVERSSADLKEILRLMAPKLDDLAGFAKHRAPFIADKTDLTALKSALEAQINQRPTRRQSITDVALIVGLIGGLLAIGTHLAH